MWLLLEFVSMWLQNLCNYNFNDSLKYLLLMLCNKPFLTVEYFGGLVYLYITTTNIFIHLDFVDVELLP